MEKCSVYTESEKEAQLYKWLESEKAGCDLGESAVRRWVQNHWWGYLRARWLEHLQGARFWVELDRGDFGLLQRRFQDQSLLLGLRLQDSEDEVGLPHAGSAGQFQSARDPRQLRDALVL